MKFFKRLLVRFRGRLELLQHFRDIRRGLK